MTCLACNDITPLIDALEQVLKDHGVPFERIPEQNFAMQRTKWRDGTGLF